MSIARSCTGVRFVDTNVLLYAISGDPEEKKKAARANELLSSRDVGLSIQVLQEFYVQATRDRPLRSSTPSGVSLSKRRQSA